MKGAVMAIFNKTKPVKTEEEKAASKVRRTQVANLKEQVKTLQEERKQAVKVHEAKAKDLKDEIDTLTKYKDKWLAVRSREIEVEEREKVVTAKASAFTGIEKELSENRKQADSARDEGHKKGYADGVADGLREATKITSEDRKMMAQIAALAASSHQTDANKQIAEAIAKDIHNALPSGKKQ